MLLVLLSSIAFCTTSAMARPHHGHRHAGISHHHDHTRHFAHRHYRSHVRVANQYDTMSAGQTYDRAGAGGYSSSFGGGATFGGGGVVAEARRYIGGNPTGRGSLWCAAFMNLVLEHTGHKSTGSNMARSFASYGTRVSGPQVGAIAVMSRGRRGGHVGVVSGIDPSGNPIIISGNHGHRVAESTYSRGRIYAYVMPM